MNLFAKDVRLCAAMSLVCEIASVQGCSERLGRTGATSGVRRNRSGGFPLSRYERRAS